MAKCEQCGAEFSNWFGDVKRLCPNCEQQRAPQAQGEILPPVGEPQPRPQLPTPIATRVLIGINVAVFLGMALTSGQFVDFKNDLVLRWGADYGILTASGEWWRMLTAMFLHGGIIHIAVNMWALRNLGYTAELFYGRRNFLIIYFLSGLSGSAATMIWNPYRISVGASGAIFGVAGALAALVYFKKLPVDRARLRSAIGSIGGVIVVNLLIGASVPIIDNSAHVGGLIAGTLLGLALPAAIFREERQKSAALGNVAIALVLAVISAISLYCHMKVAPDAEAYKAEAAYDAGRKPEAVVHAQRAADLHPQSLYANYIVGAVFLETGDKAKALPFLQRASTMRPNDQQLRQLVARATQSDPQ